ncbi:hypothetical protein Tco_0480975 [Tanacetum coccineum]
MKPSKILNPTKSTMLLLQELNLLKQKQVSRRSKLDQTRQRLLQLLKEKRLKTLAKADKPAKKKQTAKTAKAKGTDEGTSDKPGVSNVPTYGFDDEQISWKSSEEEDDDEVVKNDDDDDNDDDDADSQEDDDNDSDDFVHPKFFTHDEEDIQEEGSDLRVYTPSYYESTDDEDSDEEIQGMDVEEEEMDKENTNEEEEVDELYRDVNVNLEGRDIEMTDALRTSQVIKDTHVIITLVNPEGQQQSSSMSFGFVSNMLNPSPDTGIDFIFNLNTESTSLVDVSVTTIAETPLLSATTLPPPPIPLIPHPQQTPIPTPTTVPSSSLQDLPNFGSLFGFDHRLKTLETDFLEFKQKNQFAATVSLIPCIVDAYLANKMHEAIKTAVQLKSDRLKDEAHAKNAEFINKLDDNIKKIIKDQVKEQVKAQVSKILLKIKKTVNEQLQAEVLNCSSNESKTSHAIVSNLSELELKKILIDKMESNKSIHRSDEQKNLYKALVDAYESDKLILDTYEDTLSFKRQEPMHTAKDLEEPAHHEFKIGVTEDQPDEETSQLPDWFQKPAKPPTAYRDWNKTLPDVHGPLKVDTLTPELLAGLTFELMKGSCKSLVEIEYFFEEVYKATTDQLDWNNPESQQYPHDLRKPLPLIPNSRGRQVIPFDHFINNDLAYLSGGVSSQKYTTLVTKTKAADYGGFIYQNKDKKNKLMCIDELHKFSDGTLNDVRTALNDRLKGIQIKYLPQTIWRQSDRDKAGAMIQAIDKQIKARRIMQSLEKFVSGRPYHLGVESYQKKLNLTKPDTYRSYLKRREAYWNGYLRKDENEAKRQIGHVNGKDKKKDKKNRLMRIDELHKFSDGKHNDVRTALDDHLKGIRMKYLPQTIWRQSV